MKITRDVKQTRFPLSLFFILFGVLLLMSGIHVGIVVLMNYLGLNKIVQSIIPIIYWAAVAWGLVFYIRCRIKETYDQPMKMLADGAAKVANGDFSVYIKPSHTADKADYIDLMILDFNKMVEELGSIETLKTDFISNVSHEIKTPLAVIQNTAELMQNKTLMEEQRGLYIETIIQSSKRLSLLITNILKLNKLEKQTIIPERTGYNLCEQLVQCALQFESVWEQKNIEFIADIEERVFIFADQGMMDIVWTNLLSNAFKFTKNTGSVSLSQTSSANNITVKISDTGCGMGKETAAHIFDKFYQGDTSHTAEGNGLGLALVRRVLQLMDFSIAVESAPEKGSVFTVTIPKMYAEEQSNERTE